MLISSAELSRDAQAAHPLESQATLTISANSTRRVKWHAKLGLFTGYIPSLSLAAAHALGGNIFKTEVTILRKYPDIWLIDDAANNDGRRRTMTRRQRERWIQAKELKSDKKRQALIDDVQYVYLQSL